MVIIRSKLNQRIIVNLVGGKNIDLLAKGTANVSEKELLSPHLQALISKGDIVAILPVKPEKREETEASKEDEVVRQSGQQPKNKGKK